MNHQIDVTRRRIGRNRSQIETNLEDRFQTREVLDNLLVWAVTFLFAISTFHLMLNLRQSTVIGILMAVLSVAATEGVFLSYLHFGFPLAENATQKRIAVFGLITAGVGSFVFAIADLSLWLGYALTHQIVLGSFSMALEGIVIAAFVLVAASAVVLKATYRLASSKAKQERRKSEMQLAILEKQYHAELEQATADFDILQAQVEQRILSTLQEANALRQNSLLPEDLATYAKDVLNLSMLPETVSKAVAVKRQDGENVLYDKVCPQCGDTFTTDKVAQRYCPNKPCRQLAAAERRRTK